MVCIKNVAFFNVNKVHSHGKTMWYRLGNLDGIYHKYNKIQGWEYESDNFWNEIVSSFYFLNKYVNTDVLQYHWISCRKVSLYDMYSIIFQRLLQLRFKDLLLFCHLHFTKKLAILIVINLKLIIALNLESHIMSR